MSGVKSIKTTKAKKHITFNTVDYSGGVQKVMYFVFSLQEPRDDDVFTEIQIKGKSCVVITYGFYTCKETMV